MLYGFRPISCMSVIIVKYIMSKMSNVVVVKVESQKNTYTRAILKTQKYLADYYGLIRTRDKENNPILGHFAKVTER